MSTFDAAEALDLSRHAGILYEMRQWVAFAAFTCLGACSLVTDLSGYAGGDDAASGDASTTADARPTPTPTPTPTPPGDAGADPDGQPIDAATPTLAVVQTATRVATGTSTSVDLPSPTAAGNTLVVAVVPESSSAPVSDITDDASDGYVSAGLRSVDMPCDNSAELWYAKDIRGNARRVTVSTSKQTQTLVWVLELRGVDRSSAFDKGAVLESQPNTPTMTGPTVTTTGPAVVVSVIANCGTISALAPGSPFTALPILDGNAAAYYVAATPGAYGPAWRHNNGTWNASTASFKAP